jgi:lipopolysaccharide biosynthesis regulator YciM
MYLTVATLISQQSKSDLAQDLCRKTLLENKSCSQAWEILGLIFEKEAKYDLAADAYAKVSRTCDIQGHCSAVALQTAGPVKLSMLCCVRCRSRPVRPSLC